MMTYNGLSTSRCVELLGCIAELVLVWPIMFPCKRGKNVCIYHCPHTILESNFYFGFIWLHWAILKSLRDVNSHASWILDLTLSTIVARTLVIPCTDTFPSGLTWKACSVNLDFSPLQEPDQVNSWNLPIKAQLSTTFGMSFSIFETYRRFGTYLSPYWGKSWI